MTLTFSYGERTGIYTGHIIDNIPDGIGKFVSKNEAGEEWTYIGEWKNGHFNGYGTSWFANGEINCSTYEEDIASGSGIFLFPDGRVYFGDVQNGQFAGNGTLLSLSGSYNGEFSDDTFNGNGTLYLLDGCIYQGIFLNGFLNGESTISFPGGEKAVGIFHADDFGLDGNGTFYSTDGQEYECTFINGTSSFITADGESVKPEIPAKISISNKQDTGEAEQLLTEEQAAKEAEQATLAQAQVPQPSAPQSSGTSSSDGSNFNTYDNEAQQETSASYVLNTNTMKIHHPSCKSVKKIAPQNYATSNSSVEELVGQGYSTCGNCF